MRNNIIVHDGAHFDLLHFQPSCVPVCVCFFKLLIYKNMLLKDSDLKKNQKAPSEDRTRDLSLTKRTHYHYATEAILLGCENITIQQ